MPVEICTVSGYSEFGKNMTAIRYGKEVVIVDMGIHPENYIRFSEDTDDMARVTTASLVKAKAIPDISPMKDWKDDVIAVVPGHAHLDHCGAIPFLAGQFKAPILCTPFTAEVIRNMVRDSDLKLKNPLEILQPNGKKKLSKNITVELINATHSTPQASIVAVHTPAGVIVYASDFKLDETPLLGKPTNVRRLKELASENVRALIIESTYGDKPGRTPSEAVARDMLRDALDTADTKRNAIVVTTFSSHLARLKSIVELAQKHGRKVVFLGRSMAKYVAAGENAGIIKFSDTVEIVKYGSKVERKLKEIARHGKQRYLLVATGHQGEPKSVLSRMITQHFLDPKDYIIFSCRTIPTPTNIANRDRLERELSRLGIKFMVGVHQSGHGAQDELSELITMVKPSVILPSHGESKTKHGVLALAKKLGYKDVRILKDGDRISV